MSRNGSGTYSLPSGNPVVTNTTITTTWANTTLTDIANALTASIASDGQTPITANLPMSTYKHTNVAVASNLTDYARADQAQDSSLQWLSSVSGTDTITATATITPSAYAAGQTFRFIAAGTNTGAVTLNVSSLGAKSITKNGTNALIAGDISSGAVIEVTYDGTQFQLINDPVYEYNGPYIIINHDGMINQRASSSNADDTYGLDRWNILTQSGSISVTTITDVANGTPYMMRHTQSQASAQRFGTSQIVESNNCKSLRGNYITVGVKHKISSAANIRIAILEWTGTADSATSDVVNNWASTTYTAGNFFISSNLTVNTVSSSIASTSSLDTSVLSAQLGSSMNNLIIFVWTESTTAQNVTLDLVIDVRIGTYSSNNFPFYITSYGQQLSLCQRYYLDISDSTYIGRGGSTTLISFTCPTPVALRSTPTLTSSTVGAGPYRYDASSPSGTASVSVSGISTKNLYLNVSNVTGVTNNAIYSMNFNSFANCEL